MRGPGAGGGVKVVRLSDPIRWLGPQLSPNVSRFCEWHGYKIQCWYIEGRKDHYCDRDGASGRYRWHCLRDLKEAIAKGMGWRIAA